MNNGQLYINATYINTGNLNANLITSGKIQSANGKVYFDLTNNELRCNVLTSTYSDSEVLLARLANGYLGGNGTSSGGGYQVKGLLLYNESYAGKGLGFIPGNSSDSPRIMAVGYGFRIHVRTQQGGGTRDTGYAGLIITNDGYLCLHAQNSNMSDSNASGNSANYMGRIVCHPRYGGSGTTYSTDGTVEIIGPLEATYGTAHFNSIQASGSKNRVVATKNYGKRLLSCYETPEPLFGDVGSGITGTDGTCVVSIDDIFQETARTDMAYQVLLQKCGQGDIWVSEKHPTYFVVEGTPNLSFDWQIMAHQTDFEYLRLEDSDINAEAEKDESIGLWPEDAYDEFEYNYAQQIESLYEEEIR